MFNDTSNGCSFFDAALGLAQRIKRNPLSWMRCWHDALSVGPRADNLISGGQAECHPQVARAETE